MESELCDGELSHLENLLQTVSPRLVFFHNYFMVILTEVRRIQQKEFIVLLFKNYE